MLLYLLNVLLGICACAVVFGGMYLIFTVARDSYEERMDELSE